MLEIVKGEKPIAPQVIADSIVEIAKAMRELKSTRLKQEAIVLLVKAGSGLPQKTIKIVIEHLADLETKWLKPETQLEYRLNA